MLKSWGFSVSSQKGFNFSLMLSFISISTPGSAWQSNAKIWIKINLTLLDSVRPLTTDPEHVDGSLVQLDEHSVVDLPQPEQLGNLLNLGRHLKRERKLIKVNLSSFQFS